MSARQALKSGLDAGQTLLLVATKISCLDIIRPRCTQRRETAAMGLANAIVRNYSSLALVVAGSSFGYGLFYSVTHNSSPLADAKASLGERIRLHPPFGELRVAPLRGQTVAHATSSWAGRR